MALAAESQEIWSALCETRNLTRILPILLLMHQEINPDNSGLTNLSLSHLEETLKDLIKLLREEWAVRPESDEYQRMFSEYQRISKERERRLNEEVDSDI